MPILTSRETSDRGRSTSAVAKRSGFARHRPEPTHKAKRGEGYERRRSHDERLTAQQLIRRQGIEIEAEDSHEERESQHAETHDLEKRPLLKIGFSLGFPEQRIVAQRMPQGGGRDERDAERHGSERLHSENETVPHHDRSHCERQSKRATEQAFRRLFFDACNDR